MSHTVIGRAAASAVAVSVLAGCGAATPSAQPSPAPASAAPATPTQETISSTAASAPPSAPVPQTLRFTATTLDGKPFDAATLAGKPVVLWFWAAWCPKCRAKAADVTAAAREHGGAVHVVGVAGLGSGQAAMRKFATDTGIDAFSNLADDKGEVWRRFDVTSQEYFVILDRDGKVVHRGGLSGDDLLARVAALAG
jgi:peroxiredoxin